LILRNKVNNYFLPDLPDDLDEPELLDPLLLERVDEERAPLLLPRELEVEGLLIRVVLLDRDPLL